MTATPVNIPVSEADLKQSESGAGAYATLVVPADYRLKVTAVTNWTDKATKKVIGWAYTLTINEEQGMGLPFKYFLSFEKERRAKMLRFFDAVGSPLQLGDNQTDPQEIVEAEAQVGGRIDFPRKYYDALREDGGEPGENVANLGVIYREVRWVFPLAEFPAEDGPHVNGVDATAVPILA